MQEKKSVLLRCASVVRTPATQEAPVPSGDFSGVSLVNPDTKEESFVWEITYSIPEEVAGFHPEGSVPVFRYCPQDLEPVDMLSDGWSPTAIAFLLGLWEISSALQIVTYPTPTTLAMQFSREMNWPLIHEAIASVITAAITVDVRISYVVTSEGQIGPYDQSLPGVFRVRPESVDDDLVRRGRWMTKTLSYNIPDAVFAPASESLIPFTKKPEGMGIVALSQEGWSRLAMEFAQKIWTVREISKVEYFPEKVLALAVPVDYPAYLFDGEIAKVLSQILKTSVRVSCMF